MLPLIRTAQIEEILVDIDWGSFTYEWQQNQSRQVSFTIYRTDANADLFDLLQNKWSSIIYDGEEYVVHQCTPKSSGQVISKEIVAMHVSYECQKQVWQYNTQGDGTTQQTYHIEDVMHYYFDGNSAGFDFEIIGAFPTAQLTQIGNGSGKDGIDLCIATWSCNVWAVGRHIILMDDANWKKITNNHFRYLYNTDDVQASIDDTGIVNSVMCYGAKTQDADGNDTGYAFPPYVHQNAASIAQWGECKGAALTNDQISTQSAMDTYAETQMQTNPAISLALTYQGTEPINEGDVWIFVHEPLGFDTDVTVVGLQKTPYSGQKPQITFSNTAKDIIQIMQDIAGTARQARTSAGQALTLSNNIQTFVDGNMVDVSDKVGEVS